MKVDIFSLGGIVLFIFSSRPPFDESSAIGRRSPDFDIASVINKQLDQFNLGVRQEVSSVLEVMIICYNGYSVRCL